MNIKLSPELLVGGFVRSATNGRNISVRFRRILTLIVFPLWIMGLILGGYYAFSAIEGYKEFNDDSRRLNVYRYNKSRHIYSDSQQSGYDPVEENYQMNVKIAEDKRDRYYFTIYLLLILIVIPWIVVRLTFWVINADKSLEKQDR